MRPALRYFGGKWRLATWIIGHFPDHHVYVEPFGGAASVLLRKPRAYAEVYNDTDGEIVNYFRMLRDCPAKLLRAIELTPYSREEYATAYGPPSDDPVERARRTILKSFMGFGADSITRHNGFRGTTKRSSTTPATDWGGWPTCARDLTERLRGVVIEQRPALDLIRIHDGDDTLFYVDQPYLHSTRTDNHGYRNEMTDADHVALAAALNGIRGKAIVSGYASPLYGRLYAGWRTSDKETRADGARKRTERLWLNF